MIRKVAAERIEILYDAAVRTYPNDQELSKGYIKLLLEIGRHYKIRITKEMAAHICKKCSLPLVSGMNLQTRVLAKEKRYIYRCSGCGTSNSLDFKPLETGRKR